MGRSGGRGGGRSGGGRSGGSRSSGRSAFGGSSRSSSRSFNSSASRGFNSNRRPVHGGSFGGGFGRGFGGGFGGGHIRGGNIFVNVDNHQETYTNTNNTNTTTGGSTVYTEPQQTVYTDTTGRSARKSGGFTSIIAVIVWIMIFLGIFSWVGGGSGSDEGSYGFTKSTVNRDKLELHLSDDAGYYTDECGWIRNSTTLERGLKEFYDSTGILPYVYIIDNVEGDYDPSTEKLEAFAEAKYEALFDDEGHALLLFWDYGGAYEYVLMLGYDTMELMDSEACDILFDYLDYYYYYADTEEEFFADAFADAGERMMTVTRSPWYYILRIGAAVAVIFVAYKWWKSRQEKEAERKKRAEEILNSPLEKFGENGDDIDELEKKYEKEI